MMLGGYRSFEFCKLIHSLLALAKRNVFENEFEIMFQNNSFSSKISKSTQMNRAVHQEVAAFVSSNLVFLVMVENLEIVG